MTSPVRRPRVPPRLPPTADDGPSAGIVGWDCARRANPHRHDAFSRLADFADQRPGVADGHADIGGPAEGEVEVRVCQKHVRAADFHRRGLRVRLGRGARRQEKRRRDQSNHRTTSGTNQIRSNHRCLQRWQTRRAASRFVESADVCGFDRFYSVSARRVTQHGGSRRVAAPITRRACNRKGWPGPPCLDCHR